MTRELLQEEQTKCRAYGQRHGYDLNQLDLGMIPVVLEQYGRTAPGAHAIFQRLIHHRTQLLVRQGLAPYSRAKRQACTEMWAPLACLLLRAAWQSIAASTSACLHRSRPGRHSLAWQGRIRTQLGWTFCPPRPGLRRTLLLLLSCPPQGWQRRWA